MEKFVRLKHYAIFLLVIVLPIALMILMSTGLVSLKVYGAMRLEPILLNLFICCSFIWLYSLGIQLHQKLSRNINLNLQLFKFFFIIPVVCFFILTLLVSKIISIDRLNQKTWPLGPIIFLIVFIFSLFCTFYSCYFIARCLKSNEKKHPAKFSEWIGYFFLILILPIGIWILQPKINKVFDEEHYEIGSDIEMN